MRVLFVCCLLLLPGLAFSQSNNSEAGLLIMAHGGSDAWNAAVEEATGGLPTEIPVSIAFGMANPATLQQGVDELVSQGVKSIAVVRLFVSAESFLAETEYAFGLSSNPPGGHLMHEPKVLELSVPVSLNKEGLLDAQELSGILADRALNLSQNPEAESVLIIGHGPGDDEENLRWLSKMDVLAEAVRTSADFHSVQVSTLREDWTGKRKVVEEELRRFVELETTEGRQVIVVPFRLFGFGPYAEVFEGLSYRTDSLGLLPDERIGDWIESQYEATRSFLPRVETRASRAN